MSRVESKTGFTLMELMVYIAILGVVVLVAGQALTSSTKFRVRSHNMLKSSDDSERLAAIFAEDVAQMGAKSFKASGDAMNPDRFETVPEVYMDLNGAETDSSSYSLNNTFDSLTFRRVRYTDDGRFASVDEISWFKRGHSVYRSCIALKTATGVDASEDCPKENPPEVVMAENVDEFKILPAKPVVTSDESGATAFEKSIVLPVAYGGIRSFRFVPRYDLSMGGGREWVPLSFDPPDGGTHQVLSGFYGNYDPVTLGPKNVDEKLHQVFVAKANTGLVVEDGDHWKDLCNKVTLDSATEYEVSFNIPFSEDNSRLFSPGRDHAAVGFRKLDGSMVDGLEDFLFYPPASHLAPPQRNFRFSLKNKIEDVCMAFTFVSYSPAPTGKITISNLLLRKMESSNFNFVEEELAIVDKQNVKAFLLDLVVSHKGESNKISQVVPTPSNGPRD